MTLYFSVIGNRDYIKLKGEKLPYWHFLDEQPAGWLTSLTYKRKGLPTGKPMIYDCGAWSYKDKEIPPRGCLLCGGSLPGIRPARNDVHRPRPHADPRM